VKNPTTLTEISNEQLHYKPIIVQCSKFDADAVLKKLKDDIEAGNSVNELELVYLLLFSSSKFSPTELFLKSNELVRAMQADDTHKRKILALLVTLAGKVVEWSKLEKIIEEAKKMGNLIIEYCEEIGEKRKGEETARKMVAKGYDVLDIIEITGISAERLREIVKQEAV
jgi:hypothetical protein